MARAVRVLVIFSLHNVGLTVVSIVPAQGLTSPACYVHQPNQTSLRGFHLARSLRSHNQGGQGTAPGEPRLLLSKSSSPFQLESRVNHTPSLGTQC